MRNGYVVGALLALSLVAAGCGTATEGGCSPVCGPGFTCVSGACVAGAGSGGGAGGGLGHGGAAGGGAAGSGAGGSGGSGGGSGSSAFPGLNCDVAAVLASKCVGCHGSPLAGSAPYPLLTRDDLVRPSPIDATQTVAQRSVTRMRATVSPMPPAAYPPAATAQDVAAFDAWISRGTPVESCGAPPDAGTPPDDGGAVIVTPPPGDAGVAPTTCTSGIYWILGDLKSGFMNPGKACRSCHQTRAPGALYTFMGTVYPTLHEKDLCSSNASGVTVEILDGTGAVQATLLPNLDGNFYGDAIALSLPYTARLKRNGAVSTMNTPQTSGDCNACHTEQGAMGAPGRLVAP